MGDIPIYNLNTLCLNGTLSCIDFMDVVMADIPTCMYSQQPDTTAFFDMTAKVRNRVSRYMNPWQTSAVMLCWGLVAMAICQ